MKIREIRELSVALEGQVANAVISFADHTVSLVAVICEDTRHGKRHIGYGFNSIGRYAQGGILRERVIPRLLAAPPESLWRDGQFDCSAVFQAAMRNEKPGGHGDRAGAIAAVELAFWDLNAKLADEPAYATIARHCGCKPLASVPTYAAGGYYYSKDSLKRLRDELQSYADRGFNAFKIKIGGAPLAHDIDRIETALRICGHGSRLAVDANGRFEWNAAAAYARAIEPLALRWFEEIGDPLDFALNREISQLYSGPIATGENLFSSQDVRNLLNFAGLRKGYDVFQMDAGLSYGLTEFARMIDLMETSGYERKFSFPHGGHLINLHIASALNLGGCEAYPDVFRPFGGFSPGCALADGRVSPTDMPGFGLEAKSELLPYLKRLSD